MFDLKQFFKKEDELCPICALPYVRGKRTLKASYFDITYDVTAWTMRCEECGYEIILPGTARIHTAAKEELAQGRYGELEFKAVPDGNGIITAPAPVTAWCSISLLEAPKELPRHEEEGNLGTSEETKTAKTEEGTEVPEVPETPKASEMRKAAVSSGDPNAQERPRQLEYLERPDPAEPEGIQNDIKNVGHAVSVEPKGLDKDTPDTEGKEGSEENTDTMAAVNAADAGIAADSKESETSRDSAENAMGGAAKGTVAGPTEASQELEEKAIKDAVKEADTEAEGGMTDKGQDALEKEPAAASTVSVPATKDVPDKASVKDASVDKEGPVEVKGTEAVAPALISEKQEDGGQAVRKAEPAGPESMGQEVKPADAGDNKRRPKTKTAAGNNREPDRQAGQSEQSGRGEQERQRKSDGWKVPDRKPTADKAPLGQERKKQAKDPGQGRQKPAAVQPILQGHEKPNTPMTSGTPVMSGIPGSRLAPKRGQFGAFQGAGPSGFAGGGIFPSSAISNLEALRASIQTGTDKKDGADKEDGKMASGQRPREGRADLKPEPGPEPANDKLQERMIRKTLSAENQMSKDNRNASGARNAKAKHADAGDDEQESSADSEKHGENIQAQKMLSAENKGAHPSVKTSEPGKLTGSEVIEQDRQDKSSEKETEKMLSTENESTPAEMTSSQEPGDSGKSEQPKDQKISKDPAPQTAAEETEGKEDDGDGVKKPENHKDSKDPNDLKDLNAPKEQKDPPNQEDCGGTEEPKKSKEPEGYKGTDKKKETKNRKKIQDARGQDIKGQAAEAAKKISDKLPPDIVEKIPVFSQISKHQKRAIFMSEEKKFLEQHIPHKQVIINDLIYDTDNSEMFLRVEGQYGLDNPCVHYNYRTQNGNFFRCTVKYKHDDSIRVLDIMETKRMLEEYPDLYRKFFPDSVSDA